MNESLYPGCASEIKAKKIPSGFFFNKSVIYGSSKVKGVFNITVNSATFNKIIQLKIVEKEKLFRQLDSFIIKYSDVYVENWLTSRNSDWETKSDSYPERTSVTRYYKTSFAFNGEISTISYIKMMLKCDAGIVVYLNQNIVYRRGLGKTFGQQEYSKTSYPPNEIKELRITQAVLKIGKNVVGVEVHANLGSPITDQFEILSVDFISENDTCTITNPYEPTMLIHSNRGYEYTRERKSDKVQTTVHVINNINLPTIKNLDWNIGYHIMNNPQDTWYGYSHDDNKQPSASNPLTITMRYPNNVAKTYTQYYLVVNQYVPPNDYYHYEFAPWIWTFYGSYDNTTETDGDWDLLQNIAEAGFSTAAETKKTFQLFNQYISYDFFRIKITRKRNQSFGNDQFFFYRLHVQYCKPRYCEAEGDFPQSIAGYTASVRCPIGFIGTKQRDCKINDAGNSVWDGNVVESCQEIIVVVTYPEIKFLKGFYDSYSPTVVSPDVTITSYEHDCELPNGVFIDEANGSIYGTPDLELDTNFFEKNFFCTITVRFSEGETIAQVAIYYESKFPVEY